MATTTYLSAGVDFFETDNSLATPTGGNWSGASVIQAGWGPVNDPQLVNSENDIVSIFGKPNAKNYKNWLASANYLAYSGSMYVTRAMSNKLCNASSEPMPQTTAGTPVKIYSKTMVPEASVVVTGYEKGSSTPETFTIVRVKVPRYCFIRSSSQAQADGYFYVTKIFRGSSTPTEDTIDDTPSVNTYITSYNTIVPTTSDLFTATSPLETIKKWASVGQGLTDSQFNVTTTEPAAGGGTEQVVRTYFAKYMVTAGVANIRSRGLFYQDANGNQSDLIQYYLNGKGMKYKYLLENGLCNEKSFVEYIRVKRTYEGKEGYEMYSGLAGITKTTKKITSGTFYKVGGTPHFAALTGDKIKLTSPTNPTGIEYETYTDLDGEKYLLTAEDYDASDGLDGDTLFPHVRKTSATVLIKDCKKGQMLTHEYGAANPNAVFYGVLDPNDSKGTNETWKDFRDADAEAQYDAYEASVPVGQTAKTMEAWISENHIIYGDEFYAADVATESIPHTFVWNNDIDDFVISTSVVCHGYGENYAVEGTRLGSVGVQYINVSDGIGYGFFTINNKLQKVNTCEGVTDGKYTFYVVDAANATHVLVDFYFAKILDENLFPLGGTGFGISSENWVLAEDGRSYVQYDATTSDYFSVPVIGTVIKSTGATLTKNPIVIKPNYLVIKNDQDYELNFEDGQGSYGEFCCRYPGKLGDSIMVTYADADNFEWWSRPVLDDFGNVVDIEDYTSYFAYAPGTSAYAQERGARNDEIHLLVIDAGGLISGVKGTILEKYEHLSKAKNARGIDGDSIFYAKVLKNKSNYIYCIDMPSGSNWGSNVVDENGVGITFSPARCNDDDYPFFHQLAGGNDDYNATDGQLEEAFEFYRNREQYDIINIITGAVSHNVAKWVVENVCEKVRDCVAFVSVGGETPITSPSAMKTAKDEVAWRDNKFVISSSYAFIDSGFKQQYDKYNDEYRVVPLCGDIAGVWAQTNETRGYGFSAAGYNRGYVKNVAKLCFSPGKDQRDVLYPKSINPVFTEPGTGTILFGDRTSLTKPSSFRFMNVRYLFIYLERILTAAAKYSLFEINDAITRANLVSMLTPTLDQCLGNRVITDYRVVCDASLNGPNEVQNGILKARIRIKPSLSINYIQLEFTCERQDATFSES